MSLKFETVLYAFAMLLLVLISLPNGDDDNQQMELLTPNQQEQSGSINVAIAESTGQMDIDDPAEAPEIKAPLEDQ